MVWYSSSYSSFSDEDLNENNKTSPKRIRTNPFNRFMAMNQNTESYGVLFSLLLIQKRIGNKTKHTSLFIHVFHFCIRLLMVLASNKTFDGLASKNKNV